MDVRLLPIYLNDHLGGSVSGAELAKRAAANNEGSSMGELLARLAVEIEEDRETLKRIMERLDVRPDPVKQAGGWLLEKVGRAKLNGQLTGYSPLSRLVELEGLMLGVTGKLSLWEVLDSLGDPALAEFDLPGLAERARRQRDELAERRIEAARDAFLVTA